MSEFAERVVSANAEEPERVPMQRPTLEGIGDHGVSEALVRPHGLRVVEDADGHRPSIPDSAARIAPTDYITRELGESPVTLLRRWRSLSCWRDHRVAEVDPLLGH